MPTAQLTESATHELPLSDSESVTIALLDDDTANRIAAGEVVERPSSVVKELIENALDSGATRLEIDLANSGKRRILVRDNGCGMSEADAILSLQRHATSKIRSADDLFAVGTFGFRGEALPSIASVSDFTLTTRRPVDDSGTEVRVRGGEIVAVGSVGAAIGTTVLVENLFYNVPARLKFLKTDTTELTNAHDWVQRFLLARPDVAIRLTNDAHLLIQYPGGTPDPRHAIAAVYGRDTVRQLVPIQYDAGPDLRVTGFVSKPSLTRARRDQQTTFVNGRFVRAKTVTAAFDSAYAELMKTDRYPVAILYIQVAPHLVDVNVHPAKIEVRFTRDGDLYQAVRRAVTDALLSGGLIPDVRTTTPDIAPSASPLMPGGSPAPRSETLFPDPVTGAISLSPDSALPPRRPSLSSFGNQTVALPDIYQREPAGRPALPRHIAETAADPSLSPENPSESLANYIGFDGHRIGSLRVIGQARNTYIVAETEDSLLFIDQHIAHERVLYEQLMNGATDEMARYGVVAQYIAVPQTIEFDPRTARVVAERLETFARAGIVLEGFGKNAFLLRATPASLCGRKVDPIQFVRDLASDLVDASERRHLVVPHDAALIMASCKLAVKKGDPLTVPEMSRLLSDLAAMRNPFTCPHGRPILIALPHAEMDRKFHRIGTH